MNAPEYVNFAIFVVFVTWFAIAMLWARLKNLGTELTKAIVNPQRRLCLRPGLAYMVFEIPAYAATVHYPRWGEMCDEIAKSCILTYNDDLTGPGPDATQILCYSPTGELTLIYMWYCIAACINNRNKDLSKPEEGV